MLVTAWERISIAGAYSYCLSLNTCVGISRYFPSQNQAALHWSTGAIVNDRPKPQDVSAKGLGTELMMHCTRLAWECGI